MKYGREGDEVKSWGTEGHARRFRRIVEPIRGERRGSDRTGRTRRNCSFANGIWTREAKLMSVPVKFRNVELGGLRRLREK